jgi:DNA-binding SARP family transcriptional activator/tetratricopeptide (TPR) repeat protein
VSTHITLLGGFEVKRDDHALPGDGWRRRQAASLVQLLALAPHRRLHREHVIDALWPDQTLAEATPKLHKASYFARRALDDNAAIVVADDLLSLLPDDDVWIDAVEFERAATEALRTDDVTAVARALDGYGGDLVPADPYAEWLGPRRLHLRTLYAELLRRAGRWAELVAAEPTDELACVETMRALRARGDHHGALRQYERLERALSTELGLAPGPEVTRLRDEIRVAADSVAPAPRAGPVGRDDELARLRGALDDVRRERRGVTAFVRGAPGSGKSELVAATVAAAEAQGVLVGSGTAAGVEGAWPYAPLLEAFDELCRHDAGLLEQLDAAFRDELNQALTGADLHWSGEGGHQRLFVAAAELLRVAARRRPVLVVLDDAHDVDDGSARLLHYLARCTLAEPVMLLVSLRHPAGESPLSSTRATLARHKRAVQIDLAPLDDGAARQLVTEVAPQLDGATCAQIVSVAQGSPFALAELAGRAGRGAEITASVGEAVLGAVAEPTRTALQRAALLGSGFDTDEFVIASELDDERAFAALDEALAARLVEHTGLRYRFRHTMVRDALVEALAPHQRRQLHAALAERLELTGAPAARVAHHLVAAGKPAAAVPHLLRAADRSAAVGAYRDAYELVERARGHASGAHAEEAAALRADLLFALGDPAASTAYRHALQQARDPLRVRSLRTRLARASTVVGDVDTAVAALAGLELDGGPADPDLLLARANLAYFQGRHDEAWDLSQQAREKVLGGDRTWQVLDLVALEGLLAHTRGEWFDRMRDELRRTVQDPEIALAIFDSYLCPAEYLLYGQTPYEEVVALATRLRDTGQRAGALRAVAFATALVGEAALLAGDLDLARRELEDAADLHREIGARSGEAHSLQRLAEVELAGGDRDAALARLQRALPLARWSTISLHLLQRIYGTLIAAAADVDEAVAALDRAEATLGTEDLCPFCTVMLAVPAATAAARAGDLDRADLYLVMAERSAALWEGTSWQAAILEARAHRRAADGAVDEAAALVDRAAALFRVAGQPLDAARCVRSSLSAPADA